MSNQIRAATTGEGFRDSCHVTARSASEPEERTHHLLVEVVPSDEDLRAILSRHGLFSKEILIYEQVRRFLWRFQFFTLRLDMMGVIEILSTPYSILSEHSVRLPVFVGSPHAEILRAAAF